MRKLKSYNEGGEELHDEDLKQEVLLSAKIQFQSFSILFFEGGDT